jgi:hypothetical protein
VAHYPPLGNDRITEAAGNNAAVTAAFRRGRERQSGRRLEPAAGKNALIDKALTPSYVSNCRAVPLDVCYPVATAQEVPHFQQ